MCFKNTSRFSNLCFSDCKVCDSWVKVSAGPLDTSPIVFLVPASFLRPPGRASPASAPLWLSQRANFEVSSLIVSFWFMIVSFCCKTVSRSCITVVFKSSPGTLFCKVAAHMSISFGTEVQMNWVCPPKSWDELCKNRQEIRKILQHIPFFVACMLAPVLACFGLWAAVTCVPCCCNPSVEAPPLLYSDPGSAQSRFTASQPEGRESRCPCLIGSRSSVTFERWDPFLLSGC